MSASKLPISQRDFEHLYMTYKPRFLRIAQSYARDAMAAEDLVTESFMFFWKSRTTVDVKHIPAYPLFVCQEPMSELPAGQQAAS